MNEDMLGLVSAGPLADTPLRNAYSLLYGTALVLIALFLLACLVRAIRGPRIADRVIAINMMGTLIVIMICILAFITGEGYLTDVAMIYTMLSFLAVVLLTKVYMGAYRERMHQQETARREEADKEVEHDA